MTETKVPGVTIPDEPDHGGSLQGYVVASYGQLVELFGEPNGNGDGYKVSTEWSLEFNGQPFRIYDYKETDMYDGDNPSVSEFRARKSYSWHIGGEGVGYGQRAPQWVMSLINAIEEAL